MAEAGADGWIASVGVVESMLAAALLGERVAGGDELEAMRTLGRSATLEDELLARVVTAVGPIVAALAPLLRELATDEVATSGGEMQDKFSQETHGTLEYGNLSTFFGGLEALVGAPDPRVRRTMAEEHSRRGDSEREFTTSNYGLRTCSATEWAFVATPHAPPAGGWPVEEKIRAALSTSTKRADLDAIRTSGAKPRMPWPIAELEAEIEAKANGQLRSLKEPVMTTDEAVGLRLYTGPLFVKYNAVLRGLGSSKPFLQKQLVALCCDAAVSDQFAAGEMPFAQAKNKVNLHTTTLHVEPRSNRYRYRRPPAGHLQQPLLCPSPLAERGPHFERCSHAAHRHVINSGIVKTSKLTFAGKVYRGVSGMSLPHKFRQANKHGVKGGIEGAFMSTTTDRAVAMQYAASGGRGVGEEAHRHQPPP